MSIRCPAFSLRLIAFVLRSTRDRGASACRDVTGTVSFLSPIRNYVDALVPVAAQQDALTAARYRAFILPRLLGSLAALILGWIALRQRRDVFFAAAAVVAGGAGLVLLLTQVTAAS